MLLSTKVKIPPLTKQSLNRQRLIDKLEATVPQYKLIHISAPAGYGKTTLLTHWAHSSDLKVAWFSIDSEDNDLERFLRYLFRAWEQIQPDIYNTPLGLLLEAMSPEQAAVLSAFINVADAIPAHTVFVLDDYHLINDQSIHESITYLLDHLPSKLHVVLTGRGKPPLPLARYRARREVLELRLEDLQFSSDETADFLNHLMHLDLTQDTIESLQNQTEGWVAGLQLAALTLQRRLTGADKLVRGGQYRFIIDYLNEDVLESLQRETQDFLLQTSILDRLCESLCDAVTDGKNSQRKLDDLEADGLFLVPLDERREWFRYHQLFADFLREELERRYPDQLTNLHRRSARWYLDHELPEQAFHHAIAGDDPDLVVEMITLYLNAKVVSGEIKLVKYWVDRLPERWLDTHPILGLIRASFLIATGAFEESIHYLDAIEQNLMPLEDDATGRQQLARVTAFRCYVACFQNNLPQAEAFANRALRGLPEDDSDGFRGSAYVALGDTYRRNGHWEAAKQSYLKVLDVSYSAPFRFRAAHVYGALADLELRQGHLQNSWDYWGKALESMQDQETWGRLPLPVTGWVHIRMGELLYELNELEEAWQHLAQGLERAELGGDVRAMIAGYLIAGRLKLTEGDLNIAIAYLEQARPHVETAQFAHWNSRFERFQLEVWLAQDRLRTAAQWSDTMLQDATVEQRPESEVAQLAIARVLIVKGDTVSIEQGLGLLERLLEIGEGQGRIGVSIESLALLSIAHWKRGKQMDALTGLKRALRLAEPEGYIRLFADLGLPMGRLLQEAQSRHVMLDYVEKLLRAFGVDLTSTSSANQSLPEPLTEREQEILKLIAAGLTNPEIAQHLVISPQTVKKHAGNIYGKLGVNNRTEAAAYARKLDLLR